MGMYGGLLDQLEDAIGGGSLSRRADVLRRVTDLFMSASGSFSDPQLELFSGNASYQTNDNWPLNDPRSGFPTWPMCRIPSKICVRPDRWTESARCW